MSGGGERDPAVLVLTCSKNASTEIIQNILKQLDQSDTKITRSFFNISSYLCCIKTKYYNNNIILIPWDTTTDLPSSDILDAIEAVIVYFDPFNKSGIHLLQDIQTLVKDNGIEMGILLLKSFLDSSTENSFKEMRERSDFCFDIVSLANEGGDNIYFEIVEALKNHIWSNVKLPNENADIYSTECETSEMEHELEVFENLFSSVQNIRNSYQTRDELLDQAEVLAKKLSTIIFESDSE